jgi:hypothetical protein
MRYGPIDSCTSRFWHSSSACVWDAAESAYPTLMPLVLDPLLDGDPTKTTRKEEWPSTITVTRTSEQDFKQRQLIVSLDGVKLATLLFGDSITKDIPPGPHRLRVSNTLVWKNVEFTLRPGEQAFFEVINRAGRATYPMLLIFGVGPLYVTINRMI